MPAAVRIRTERLWLRPFAPADVDALHALFAEPGVRRYLLDDEVMPRDWVAEVVASSEASFAAHGWGLWSIAERDGGDPVGFTGYREFREPPVLELIWGLHPRAWGRGWAREASEAALHHGFETLGFDPILASTDAPNEASLALARRLGFRETHRGPGPAHEQVHLALARAAFAPTAGRHEVASERG